MGGSATRLLRTALGPYNMQRYLRMLYFTPRNYYPHIPHLISTLNNPPPTHNYYPHLSLPRHNSRSFGIPFSSQSLHSYSSCKPIPINQPHHNNQLPPHLALHQPNHEQNHNATAMQEGHDYLGIKVNGMYEGGAHVGVMSY